MPLGESKSRILMPVTELQARLEKVSSDIERQKDVLQKLEWSKCALQRQLNAVRDPVSRLPLEISSDIFIRCLPARPQPGARDIPMFFFNICHAWMAIAISTPALWAAIHIDFPRAEGFSEGLGTWLSRACNLPLSMSLRGTFDDGVATVVRQHAEKLRSLEVYASDRHGVAFLQHIESLPSLETLTLATLLEDGQRSFQFTPHETVEILRRAPNLVECIFDEFNIGFEPESDEPSTVLPALRHLKFRRTSDGILRYLTLPSLETLRLSHFRDHFGPFWKRSSPSLQKLTLTTWNTFPPHTLEALRLMTTVRHFEWDEPHIIYLRPFFEALADSPSLLPNLQAIDIKLEQRNQPDDASYKAASRALSLRRAQIVCVELIGVLDRPQMRILAAFRRLEADGMKIHIGPKNQNFI
ncbi:hypothetical protein B0H17DRAFT_342546 [Mycena rosella]|uniref:F-box domain-containing protein n=1 Tax=Mycena rosella TaxID=1033263 RepID=A0AAD7CRG7_MYCRO|nr:hypothetical protein B0H17DRAFT_342546 [Mycena rosella]